MADHKYNPANQPLEEPEIAKDYSEKQAENDSSSQLSPVDGIGSDDEIIWHYLTFETSLPCPAHVAQPSIDAGNRQQPPECPDLKKFTNPFYWPRGRKIAMTWMGGVATTLAAFSAGSYATGIPLMMEEWHISEPAAEVGIALFTAGFGVAPMFLAPFSGK